MDMHDIWMPTGHRLIDSFNGFPRPPGLPRQCALAHAFDLVVMTDECTDVMASRTQQLGL